MPVWVSITQITALDNTSLLHRAGWSASFVSSVLRCEVAHSIRSNVPRLKRDTARNQVVVTNCSLGDSCLSIATVYKQQKSKKVVVGNGDDGASAKRARRGEVATQRTAPHRIAPLRPAKAAAKAERKTAFAPLSYGRRPPSHRSDHSKYRHSSSSSNNNNNDDSYLYWTYNMELHH